MGRRKKRVQKIKKKPKKKTKGEKYGTTNKGKTLQASTDSV